MTNESLLIPCEFMKINIIYVLTGSVSKRSIIHKHWDKKKHYRTYTKYRLENLVRPLADRREKKEQTSLT